MILRAPARARPKAAPTHLPIQRYRPDMLMRGLVLFSWISIWRLQDCFPVLAQIRFPIIVEIIVLTLFLMDSTRQRKIKWIRSPLFTAIMVLLGIMMVGLPTSLWAGKGFNFLWQDFVPTLVLMTMLATSIREQSDLEYFAFGNLLGGIGFAVYVYLYCPLGYSGRLGDLPFYDANDFALLLVCTIPFAIYFLRPGVPFWKRIISAGTVGFFAMMIIRTGSRGGFLGLIPVTLYILLFYRSVPQRARITAVAIGVAAFAAFGSARYWKMMQTILHPSEDYNMKEETGRKKVWQRGVLYMGLRPLTGVGIRAFPQAEGTLSPVAKQWGEMGKGIKWSVAHNSYVEIGAECGPFALVLFLWMVYYAFYTLARVRAGPRGDPWVAPADQAFAQTLIGSFLGYVICAFFISAEYYSYLYILYGLLLGQLAIFRRRVTQPIAVRATTTEEPRRAQKRPIRPQWLPAGP